MIDGFHDFPMIFPIFSHDFPILGGGFHGFRVQDGEIKNATVETGIPEGAQPGF